MNAAELLTGLQSRGVVATVNADKLKLHGAPEVLTPKVLAAVKAHKPAIIELLSTPSSPPLQLVPPLATTEEAERIERIRRMASQVSADEFRAARKRIKPELRRSFSSIELHECILGLALADHKREVSRE